MDDFVTQLFSYVPEKWRPYLAILLLVLYVVTKIRSHIKSAQLATLQDGPPPGVKGWGVPEPKEHSKLGKVASVFFSIVC